MKHVSGTEACQILIRDDNVPSSIAGYMRSDNQGVTWTQYTDQSLLFWVYGTVTTVGEPQIQSTYALERVAISLQAGADDRSVVQTGVRLLNRPEVIQ